MLVLREDIMRVGMVLLCWGLLALLTGCAGPVATPTPTPTPVSLTLAGRIAFASNRDGYMNIYVMSADGSGQTNLTNNPHADYEPSWGP